MEHDRFVDGHGIWLGGDGDTVTGTLTIRFNESIDVGRYGHPTEGNCRGRWPHHRPAAIRP